MKFILILLFISTKTLCQNPKIGIVDFEYLIQNFPDGSYVDSSVFQCFKSSVEQEYKKITEVWFKVYDEMFNDIIRNSCGIPPYDFQDSIKTVENKMERFAQFVDSLDKVITKELLNYKETAIENAVKKYTSKHKFSFIVKKENPKQIEGVDITSEIFGLLDVDKQEIVKELIFDIDLSCLK